VLNQALSSLGQRDVHWLVTGVFCPQHATGPQDDTRSNVRQRVTASHRFELRAKTRIVEKLREVHYVPVSRYISKN